MFLKSTSRQNKYSEMPQALGKAVFQLKLRGGMPNVGMENWTSDFDRVCWNESNPDIMSPMFVPKGNWTEEDFEKARRHPAFQDETSQKLIQAEYERLNGIPHSYPRGEDPWRGQRGESFTFGANPFANIPDNNKEGILKDPYLTFTLQATAYQVIHKNMSYRATDILTLLGALRALKIVEVEEEIPALYPLKEDEYKGPDWCSDAQRDAAVTMLREALVKFLGPTRPPTLEPPRDLTLPDDLWDPPEDPFEIDDQQLSAAAPA